MLVDIDGPGLERRAQELPGIEIHHADCADEAAVRGYVDAAVAKFGRIDGFFNNAGVEGDLAPTPDYPVAEYDRIVNINLRGGLPSASNMCCSRWWRRAAARWSTPPRSAVSAALPAAGPTMPPSTALSA